MVNQGEMTLAYKDDHFMYHVRYPETANEQKKIMARHETVNRRVKQWNILNTRFRHDISHHRNCFYAVANITQMMFDYGVKLYQI